MAFFFGNSSGNLLADRRYELALQLAEGGDHRAAADLLMQGLDLAPNWPPLHFHLGEALRQTGRKEVAREAFLVYLELDPEDRMGAAIKLALIGAAPVPETMPAGYVRSLFDQYAPKFEKVLVGLLSYHAPEMMHEEIRTLHPEKFRHVLDLGCGTGLAGQLFATQADRITGVDIAPVMIDHARQKNIYTDLHVQEIGHFLAGDPHQYDLILCADVFVYIGRVDDIFRAISSHLLPLGLFSFTTEKSIDKPWRLMDDHRFAQSEEYIRTCADQAGLNVLVARDIPLRLDAGEFLPGMLFVCQKK